jgi:hypothetical protein
MTMPINIDLPPKTRGLTAIAGAMSLIAMLLIVQIWLLSAALESFLAGKHRTSGSDFFGLDVSGLLWPLSLRPSCGL